MKLFNLVLTVLSALSLVTICIWVGMGLGKIKQEDKQATEMLTCAVKLQNSNPSAIDYLNCLIEESDKT